jgi:hypothetical protein
MSRIPVIKELINTRLASGYGGWVYCEGCSKTIGYLCYVTYDSYLFEYQCKCGNCGSMYISFNKEKEFETSEQRLISVKNRLCCPNEKSPLFTVLSKNLEDYKYEVICSACKTKYVGGQLL